MQTVEESLKTVDNIVRVQTAPYTSSGVPDVSWTKEVKDRGGDLQASTPALPVEIHPLFAEMQDLRRSK